MPDEFNRYSLAELRAYVLRNLASLRVTTVDPISGQESGTTYLGLNAQFSLETLNMRINSSLTKTSLLLNAENETLFAKEVYYDADPGSLQYPFPPDMCQLRGLWWKDPALRAPACPDDFHIMSYQDNIEDPHEFTGQLGRPTWRRVGSFFVLSKDPKFFYNGINVQGILVRYIRWNHFLVNDTDYIDLPNAQVVQEVVAWDATMDSITTQDEMVDASGVAKNLEYWNQQLEIVARNSYRPPNIRLVGPSYHYNTFIGRR